MKGLCKNVKRLEELLHSSSASTKHSMQTLAQKDTLVDEMLAIPVKPIQDHQLDFEFEFVTPQSPSSPADLLFLNGRLLPHKFPFPPTRSSSFSTTLSRSMSQTSSVSSKDSLLSSRSNSTSSRSSSSSISTSTNARTIKSTDVNERRVLMSKAKSLRKKQEVSVHRPSLSPQHGSWHYVTQTPVLSRKVSRKSRADSEPQQRPKRKKQEDKGKRNGRFFWRSWRWFLSTCSGLDVMS